jgi:acetylornithine deacetylase/succinyl-diaminopimelate desuccinylase-like protein
MPRMPIPDRRILQSYITAERKRFEESLGELVELPSISMDPRHQSDIHRTARLAKRILEGHGARAEIIQTPGNPVVFGRFFKDRRFPTLTLYNHLDVQPANESEWTHPPFKFEVQDGRYRGRGSTDDKGPALTALKAARFTAESPVGLNLQLIWELEEEIGSPHFGSFLKKMRGKIKTDSILVSDTIWMARDRPAVPYGLRGLLAVRLVLETGKKDVHSGITGGAARNPVSELCSLVAACHDPRSGRVTIPGFYQDVIRLRGRELRDLASSGFSASRFLRAYGLVRPAVRDPVEIMRRIWTRPTFEVHGITGGYQGPGVKTAIAARAEAKVSMRLVPGQSPRKVLETLKRYVKRLNPDVHVYEEGMLEPYLGTSVGPYADAARESIQFGFNRKPAFIREGGSIGAVVQMQRHFSVPIIFLGLSLPEHGYHAPNEYFDWGQAQGGILCFVKYFQLIAEMGNQNASLRRVGSYRG